mgnify:CR=1 FL=1
MVLWFAYNCEPKTVEEERKSKILSIVETVVVVFLATLIPKLIALGGPPTSINDVWEPLLSSALMGLYAYMRLRGIKMPPPEPPEEGEE